MPVSSSRRVKIVCTLGPATSSRKAIHALAKEGMDVARLNFSHGDHEFHAGLLKSVREVARSSGRNVAVMQDLQGPKISLGRLPPEGVELEAGDRVVLHPEGSTPRMSLKGRKALPISREIAESIAQDAQKGAKILFDDGRLISSVMQTSPPEILVEIEIGGLVTSHKGMNLPGTPLSVPCCTEKDFRDLKFGIESGVDAVALSFVRSAEDIELVRNRIRKQSSHRPLIFAKIEREEAVRDMDSIIDVSDGLLVARGEMAVELGADRVPVIQKQLIHACNELGVPIITATQMLESMIHNPTPTRAEASDVANAVFDGTDAVMLSGETAAGKYPLEAVRVMARIILGAEGARDRYSSHPEVLPFPGSIVDSVEFSASRIADHVDAVVIACLTHSGMAARTLSKYRPDKPIIAIMDRENALRRLAFVWGVQGVIIPKIVATDDLFAVVENVLQKHGLAEREDLVVVTAGIPSLGRGTTNMIKVHQVGAPTGRAMSSGKGASKSKS